jgi:hypothetical protein
MGRARLSAVDKLRAKAWLFGAMQASRIRIGEFGRRFAPDGASVVYRFKKGEQMPSERLLESVEQSIPGTKTVYEVGPDNAQLWKAMTAVEMKNLVKCTRSFSKTEPWFVPKMTIDDSLSMCLQEIEEESVQKPFQLITDLLACHRYLDLHFDEEPGDIGRRMCTYRLLVRALCVPLVKEALDSFELHVDIESWIRGAEMKALKKDRPVAVKVFAFLRKRVGTDGSSFYLEHPDQATDMLIGSSQELGLGFEGSMFTAALEEFTRVPRFDILPFDPPDIPAKDDQEK